jgi:uncharacterized membrane protein YcaP (DUF421 family)
MPNALHLGVPAAELVLRSVAIYLALLVGFRFFGSREIGQFTLFDLVLVLLVANAVQPAMTGPDSSLTGGVIIIATLLLTNFLVSQLRIRWPLFRRLVEPPSVVIGRDGKWLPGEVEKQSLTEEELEEALREHGLDDVKATRQVVLESDGSISVVPKDGATSSGRRRRKVRFLKR